MSSENLIINSKEINFDSKSKSKLVIKNGIPDKEPESPFDIEYNKAAKNILISSKIKSHMEYGKGEIVYYFRYVDCNNYCSFSIKGGQYIKLEIIGNGENTIETSWLKITDENLFDSKFNIILAAFEDTTNVLIDETMVLNIDHTPNIEGKSGIQFISDNKEFNMEFRNLNMSENILNFEPIIEYPKRSDVYFMHGNDFYEQNRYDLSLYYYKKGLIFGKSDDKISNRIGNLLFLLEEYSEAEKFYHLAYNFAPDNNSYKNNYIRSLIKQSKKDQFNPLLEELNNLENQYLLSAY